MAVVKTRLAQLRAEKGRISQSEVSRQTGITQKQLSALEAGKTKIKPVVAVHGVPLSVACDRQVYPLCC